MIGQLIYPDSVLSRNAMFNLAELFCPQKNKKDYYFVHSSGRRIETDLVGALIWNSLPARANILKNSLLPKVNKIIQQIQNEKKELRNKDLSFKKNKDDIVELDNEEFSEAALEAYLYVLYRAGILFMDGKSAVYSKKDESLDQLNQYQRNKATDKEIPGPEGKVGNLKNLGQIEESKKARAGFRNDLIGMSNGDEARYEKSKEEKIRAKELNNLLVSAVVITYNGERLIGPCLQSLYAQTWPNLEIIVIDNASSDRTKEIIKQRFPQVKLHGFQRNRHFAQAVNFALKKARGEMIFVLNQDVELDQDCLSHLILSYQELKTLPVGAIVPLIKFSDLRGFVNGLGNHIRPFSWGSDTFIGAVDIGQFVQLKAVPSACFAAVLILREAINQVGELDKGYGSFYEDIDWSFRCWLCGWQIVPCSQAIVYHHFGSSYAEGEKLFFVCRNRLRFILKIFSGRRLFSFLRRYLAEDIRAFLSFVHCRNWNNFFIYLKAYVSLVMHLPEIIIKRMKFKKKKIKEKNEADVLALNPKRWSFLNNNNEPILNLALIIDYYLKFLFPSLIGEQFDRPT